MPSDFECAALALDVYRDADRPSLPTGWTLYLDYTPNKGDNGYFGACYINAHDIPEYGKVLNSVVFAHRGTILSVDDLIADITLAIGDIPDQYGNAKIFYDSTVAKLKNDFPLMSGVIEYLITQIGHSLGAIIAEIMRVATVESHAFLVPQKSVSFESPGSKPILKTMIQNGALPSNALDTANQYCYVVQTHFNVINTCNIQVSDIYTIDIPFNLGVIDGPITIVPSEYYLNYYYLAGYSFSDQHKIKNIYNYLSNSENYATYYGEWPSGFENGYAAYRNISSQFEYWCAYIKNCWDTHPEIQFAYNGNYQGYYGYFVTEYLIQSSGCAVKEKIDLTSKFQLVNNSFFKKRHIPTDRKNRVLPSSYSSDDDITIMLSEYAAFASLAYGYSVPVPTGWNLFLLSSDCATVDQKSGYFGIAYIKEYSDGQLPIAITCMIAHRGTLLSWDHPITSYEDLCQDIDIAMGNCPSQLFNSALPFYQAVLNKIQVQYPDLYNHVKGLIVIEHTGHSLGAILAEISYLWMTCETEWEFDGDVVTFENPGSKTLVLNMIKDGALSQNVLDFINSIILEDGVFAASVIFNADIDAINTANEQLGWIQPPCYVGYEYTGTPDDAPYELYYIWNYSIQDQHRIIRLYNYAISHDVPVVQIINEQKKILLGNPVNFPWPVGFDAGYKYYLTYANHTQYWDGLMQYVWNTYDYIKKNYNNNYTDYVASFKNYLAQLINNLFSRSEGTSLVQA